MEFNATFIITAISFLVFVYLMNTILYRPLENIVEEREKLLSDNFNDADNAKNNARSLLEEKATQLANAKIEAKRFIDAKLKEGYDGSSEVIKNAKSKSVEFIQTQKEQLLKEGSEIEQNFDVSELANMIKDKVLTAEVRNV